MTKRLAGLFIQTNTYIHLFNVIGLECLLNTHARMHTGTRTYILALTIKCFRTDVNALICDHWKCDEVYFADYIIHFSLSHLVVVVPPPLSLLLLSDLTACEILINDVEIMMAH